MWVSFLQPKERIADGRFDRGGGFIIYGLKRRQQQQHVKKYIHKCEWLFIMADIGDVHNHFRLLYRPLKTRGIAYSNISQLGRDDFVTG